MLELVRRARQRFLNSELIAQGANAFSAALAAFILLLILGTQILDWYWLALIPAAAVAVGVYLALRRTPSPYRAAQLIDDRAQLADTISTAFFFSAKRGAAPQELLDWQRNRAEEAARTIDLPRILPYSMPRSVYLVAALALVASSLFALRYGISRSLSLRPPLARMIQDRYMPADQKQLAENRPRSPQGKDDTGDSDGANQDRAQQGQDQDQQQNADDPSNQGDSQSAQKGEAQDQASKQDQGEQGQNGQGQDQNAENQSEQNQDGGQQGNSQGESKGDPKQQSDGKQNPNNGGESGSLLSKMKDFAENLLSKMRPQQQNNATPPPQSSSQNAKSGQGQQQKGQQQNSKDAQQGQASDQADAQQGQEGDQKDGQQSQGKGAGDKSQQANKQPGSGVGSEDGDKSIKRAEQLAAMGKITELIGKRSATVTGESTVEVQNTQQTLHTAYVKRDGDHQESTTQIDRDEVPVALQSYVEQYFDQVHKQSAAAAAAPKKK